MSKGFRFDKAAFEDYSRQVETRLNEIAAQVDAETSGKSRDEIEAQLRTRISETGLGFNDELIRNLAGAIIVRREQ